MDEDKKPELEYYKNSIIHNFIRHSFLAVALLAGTEETKPFETLMEDFRFLKQLFSHEFIFERDETGTAAEVDNLLEDFLKSGLVEKTAGSNGYRITRRGFEQFPFWAGFAKTFLESYWIAARSMALEENSGKGIPALLKNMRYLGLRYHKMGLIDHREAISQITFKNAIRFWKEKIKNTDISPDAGGSVRDPLLRMARRLYDMSHCRS